MPASKHRKHNHSNTRHKKVRNRLQRGVMANVHSAIDRAKLDAEAQKDAHLPDKERGLYPKYQVARVDGSTNPGGKHEKCPKFVLDLEHDPHATPALFSYAVSARADGYELLAGELFGMIQPYVQQLEDVAKQNLLDDLKEGEAYSGMADETLKEQIAGMINEGDDLPPGADAARLVEELLVRYDKLTTKPKRTRKKKDATPDTETVKEAA
jgi:hypothetical protein